MEAIGGGRGASFRTRGYCRFLESAPGGPWMRSRSSPLRYSRKLKRRTSGCAGRTGWRTLACA